MAQRLRGTQRLAAVTGIRGANGGAPDGIFQVTDAENGDAMPDTGIILECVGQVAMRDDHGQPLPAVKLYRALEGSADGQTEGEKKLASEIGALFAARIRKYLKEGTPNDADADGRKGEKAACSRSDAN